MARCVRSRRRGVDRTAEILTQTHNDRVYIIVLFAYTAGTSEILGASQRGGAFLPGSRQFHALIRRQRAAVIVKARASEYGASRNFWWADTARVPCPRHT